MVRTKADNCARKAVAAKAPRKNLGGSSSTTRLGSTTMKSPAGRKNKYGGGNPVCPRPTPDWQKEITNFMIRSPKSASRQKENVDPNTEDDETAAAGCSKEIRTEAAHGSSSSSSSSSGRVEKETRDIEDENEEEEEEFEDEEEAGEETEEAGASSSASSSKQKFVRNNCISDSEDDD